MERVNIIKPEVEQPVVLEFGDIPIGPFYGTFTNTANARLFLKGQYHTIAVNAGTSFTNKDNDSASVYHYRPVTLDITVKEVA